MSKNTTTLTEEVAVSIPTPNQRVRAMQVAEDILMEAIRSGRELQSSWVGSDEQVLRKALIDASYRDSFPDSYQASEVAEARALIIKIGGAQ